MNTHTEESYHFLRSNTGYKLPTKLEERRDEEDKNVLPPDGELVVELVAGACLLHVCVEAHEGGGQELLADRVGHDPITYSM